MFLHNILLLLFCTIFPFFCKFCKNNWAKTRKTHCTSCEKDAQSLQKKLRESYVNFAQKILSFVESLVLQDSQLCPLNVHLIKIGAGIIIFLVGKKCLIFTISSCFCSNKSALHFNRKPAVKITNVLKRKRVYSINHWRNKGFRVPLWFEHDTL